ncbi:MAG: OmpA family protein [Myxococcota bacterium]
MATRTRAESKNASTVRRWRRVSAPMPWFPWGWMLLAALGLVFLFGLGPFAITWIQDKTERAAKDALHDVKASWATVEVSGQHVVVKGTPPSDEAASQALAAVRAARAATWAGPVVAPTRVRGDFTAAEAPAAAAPSPALEWTFRVEEGVLRLEGEVPDAASRQAIETAARTLVQPGSITSVDSHLVVVDQPVPDGFVDVAKRGLANVSACDMGVAEFSCDRYSLLCELPESRAEDLRTAASAPLPYGRVGTVQVLANEAVASCEQAMADVLGRSTIRFASESDAIDAASAPVLDEVAAAARDCPGTLRIEGHTDNTGDPAFNEDLSQRRAASVRRSLIERGLSSRRLVARGYGSRRPVDDNATKLGRSRNRRIEIRVVRASD